MHYTQGISEKLSESGVRTPSNVSEEIACIEEVSVVEDYPPDGGLRAWLVVVGVRSRVKIHRSAVLIVLFSIGSHWHGCHDRNCNFMGSEWCSMSTDQ